jgi:hypothetical protein
MVHPAQVVGEDICLALYVLELEAIGLKIEAPALEDTLRRLLHVEEVIVIRLQNELFTLQVITKFLYAVVEGIALLLVGRP